MNRHLLPTSNDKSNQISLEENDIVNENYKLNPSFSFAKVKPNDNSLDSNNEMNNTIDDASTLTQSMDPLMIKLLLLMCLKTCKIWLYWLTVKK